MPDYDVRLEFTVPTTDRETVGEFVNEIMEYIVDDTGWSVAANIVESKPEADEEKRGS